MTNQTDFSQTVMGMVLSHSDVNAALSAMSPTFAKSDFADALCVVLQTQVSPEMAHRVLQSIKRKGVIAFDKDAQLWRMTAKPPAQRFAPLAEPLKTLPLLTPHVAQPVQYHALDKFQNAATGMMQTLTCIGLIAALITLNASFAWELGREADQFRAAFVVGLMALDLMRPFLVAAGFALLARRRFAKALMGFAVAFLLSPVSVLSSTAILSSSFLLGAEMNADERVQTATLETLRGEHTRRLAEAERLNDAWRTECDRGGCGPLAAEIEVAFLNAQAEAQAVLERIEDLTDATQGASDLLARMVVTFERLGVFGQGREILLPLFLAISLELGALFGPALLLGRRRSMP
ncbi:MAG: hypothetical protein AAGM84_11340 [Pseudomonadota bacterium]